MKKILCLLLICASVVGYAQSVPLPNSIPYPYTQTGQLLNLSNTHYNATKDTTTGTLYTTTAQKASSTSLPTAYKIIGQGTISFVTSCLKASTTSSNNPVVVMTPQGSFDGTNWANIPGVTAGTVTPTSATVPLTTKWEFTANNSVYYRIKYSVTTDTASVQAWYFFNKIGY